MNFSENKDIFCKIIKMSKLHFFYLFEFNAGIWNMRQPISIEHFIKPDDINWLCINKYGQQEVSKISPRRWLNKKVWKYKDL